MMHLLSVEGLAKQFDERPLFSAVSFGVSAGERIGVIGVNGSGKSTLLKIVAGLEQPDSGQVVSRSGMHIAYLPQNPEMPPDQRVLDYLFASDDPRMVLIREYERVTGMLQAEPTNAALLARVAELTAQVETTEAWDVEREAREILTRLRIPRTDQQLGQLSGGQRRRVAMAATLMQRADLLILDEPTNHLDVDTIAWLETFLKRSRAAVLLITHDRYFLDRIIGRIVELDRGKVREYAGGYTRYLEAKAEQSETERADVLRYTSIMRKELAWLARGARGRTTKQKGRIQQIAELQSQGPVAAAETLEFTVRSPQRLGKRVVELEGVCKQFDSAVVLHNYSGSIGRGDRIGIVGPNGSGKSTLLNLIAGRVEPDRGSVVQGETVRLAYYDQESSELDERLRVIDYLAESASLIQSRDGALLTAQTMLERFLFPSAMQYARIATLSGGERRRLYLLRTLIFGPNVLLLDEPTNDLDIQTLMILEDYLDGYDGTLVVASHDRYFLDRTVDQLLVLEGNGQVKGSEGGYSAYAEERERQRSSRPAERQEARPAKQAPAEQPARPRKLTFKEQRELAEVEARIAALEAEQVALETTLAASADNYDALSRSSQRLVDVLAEIETAMERWAELSTIAEGS